MTKTSMVLMAFVALFGVGCGGPKGNSTAGLEHNNYSQTPDGKQAIRAGDGTSTAIKSDQDLEALGLKLFPEAELPRDGEVYESMSPNAKLTTYILTTKKSMKEVLGFYEKELKTKPSVSHGEVAILMGNVKKDIGVVVTIDGKVAGATEIKVQFSQKP